MINNDLQNWKPGDPLTATHLDQIVRWAQSKGNSVAGDQSMTIAEGPSGTVFTASQAGSYQSVSAFQAKIVTSGTSSNTSCSGTIDDFADNRYWLEPIIPVQQSCNIDISNQTTFSTNDSLNFRSTVVGINMSEFKSQTHFLLPGEIVNVFQIINVGSNGATGIALCFFFWETPKPFWGLITDTDYCTDSDFTDNRYFVKRQILSNTDDSYTTAAEFAAPPDNENPTCDPCDSSSSNCTAKQDNRHVIVVATNLAEQECESHLLPTDDEIYVQLQWSVGPDSMPRYTFDHSPEVSAGTFCSPVNLYYATDSTDITFSSIQCNLTGLYFSQDYFIVKNAPNKPENMAIEFKGMTYKHTPYKSSIDASVYCEQDILNFADPVFTDYTLPGTLTPKKPASNAIPYGVFFQSSDSTSATNSCFSCDTSNDVNETTIDGFVLINPCDMSWMQIQYGDETFIASTLILGPGFGVETGGESCGSPATVTITGGMLGMDCDGTPLSYGLFQTIKAGAGITVSDGGAAGGDYGEAIQIAADISAYDDTISVYVSDCGAIQIGANVSSLCPTISATATTGDPGTDAEVTVDDSSPCSPVFNFTIPRGETGPQGPPGSTVASGVSYSPANPSDWSGSPPSDVASALDRIAACLVSLGCTP